MARYNYRYLDTLLREVHMGDANAREALFAATYPQVYKDAYMALGKEYLVQDYMQKLYAEIFRGTGYPQSSRAFMKFLKNKNPIRELDLSHGEATPVKASEVTSMSVSDADLLYKFICTSNGFEQADVPMRTMVAYNEHCKNRSTVLQVLAIIAVVIVFLVPLWFLNPTIVLTKTEEQGSWGDVFILEVDSLFPVDKVTATVGDQDVQVNVIGNSIYRLAPSASGTMKVNVKLISAGTASTEAEVTQADRHAPKVENYEYDSASKRLTIWYNDEMSGVNGAASYAKIADGTSVAPTDYNDEEGWIVFTDLVTGDNLYLFDKAGNSIHLVFG
ncbi:MAG: hypothetical protein HUJ75_04335 [Parasporobacterium sp.]|nr:hypothetical protein [Parasporobacterium sp.]